MTNKTNRKAIGALVGAVVGLAIVAIAAAPAALLLLTVLAGSFIAGRVPAAE